MTTKNIVSLKSISPPRYEGEVTEWQLEQIVRGLMNPDDSFVRRLAYDRLQALKQMPEPLVSDEPIEDYKAVFSDHNIGRLLHEVQEWREYGKKVRG